MKAYEKGILIHSDDDISICNDGKYTYSETLGRIRMTQEEFIKKFPDANKFWKTAPVPLREPGYWI